MLYPLVYFEPMRTRAQRIDLCHNVVAGEVNLYSDPAMRGAVWSVEQMPELLKSAIFCQACMYAIPEKHHKQMQEDALAFYRRHLEAPFRRLVELQELGDVHQQLLETKQEMANMMRRNFESQLSMPIDGGAKAIEKADRILLRSPTRRVPREDFLADPTAALVMAESGPISVVDENGRVTMVISSPTLED